MATKAHDPCREKAADDEPIFTLRAQDISAPLVVLFWTAVQMQLSRALKVGVSPREALAAIESGLVNDKDLVFDLTNVKIGDALQCATQMAKWPTRKVAD